MRHANATGCTAWTQPDLMDGPQLFVAVSLCWTLCLSPSLPLSVMTWGPESLSLLWPHSCTSLLCGLLWIYRAQHFPAQTNLWIRRVGASMLAKPTESTRRQFNPPQQLALYNRATRDQEQWSPSADRGRCIVGKSMTRKLPSPSTGFNFKFSQTLAYPCLILSKPICLKRLNPSLELLLFSFSHDSHA